MGDKEVLLIIILIIILMGVVMCSMVNAGEDLALRTMLYEARGEDDEGLILVAKCIQERMRVRKWTLEQVIYEKGAFSCYKDKKPVQKYIPTNKDIERAKWAWNMAKENCKVPTNMYMRHDCSMAKKYRAMARVSKVYHSPNSTKLVYLGRFGTHDHFCEIRPQWKKYYKDVV